MQKHATGDVNEPPWQSERIDQVIIENGKTVLDLRSRALRGNALTDLVNIVLQFLVAINAELANYFLMFCLAQFHLVLNRHPPGRRAGRD